MTPLRVKQPSLLDAVTDCKAAVVNFTDAASKANLYHDECLRLAKFVKRLGPLLDDLQDNKPEAPVEQQGVQALKVCYNNCYDTCTAAELF